MLSVEPCSKQHIEVLLLGAGPFERQFGIRAAGDFQPARQHLEASLAALVNERVQPRWWTHMILFGEPRELIGMAGYMGNPGPDGTVEVGYELARTYRGRGLAAAVLKILIDRALQSDQVHTVCARSRPRTSASTDTLRAAGMARLAAPADAASWYWQIRRCGHGASPSL